jgi:GNAT superfamily N-acetyltransferase
MRGMFGSKWETGQNDEILHVLYATDLVIAPEHRNKGLFTHIMRAACDDLAHRGCRYVFNLSASPVTHSISLMTGWRGIGSLQPMQLRYRDDPPEVASVKKRYPFDDFDRYHDRRNAALIRPVTVESAPRPAAMADLVNRIRPSGRLRHVRDQEYFAWRFQNPLSFYRFLYCEGNELEGYLVLYAPREPLWVRKTGVHIVDWEASTSEAYEALLQAAIQWGRFNRLTVWSAPLADGAKALLEGAGFKPVEAKAGLARSHPTLLVRPVRDEMLKADWVWAGRRLLDLDSWDLRMIYSDGP